MGTLKAKRLTTAYCTEVLSITVLRIAIVISVQYFCVCVCDEQCGWYWGAMSFDEAEAMLANRRDGSFLVRDSSDERYILSLSFRSLGGTHHTRIEHYKGISDMRFALEPDVTRTLCPPSTGRLTSDDYILTVAFDFVHQ